jgi:hypothetical protein
MKCGKVEGSSPPDHPPADAARIQTAKLVRAGRHAVARPQPKLASGVICGKEHLVVQETGKEAMEKGRLNLRR